MLAADGCLILAPSKSDEPPSTWELAASLFEAVAASAAAMQRIVRFILISAFDRRPTLARWYRTIFGQLNDRIGATHALSNPVAVDRLRPLFLLRNPHKKCRL